MKKGVQESNIIFLNLISVRVLFLSKLSTSFPFPLWMHINHGPKIWHYQTLLFLLFFNCFELIICVDITDIGTSRCACGVQKVPKDKNCDLGDWTWFEWRIPCYSWHGRVWGSIFWHRWLLGNEVRNERNRNIIPVSSIFCKLYF